MKTLSTDMIRIGSARVARFAGLTAAAVLLGAVALQFAGRASAEDARIIPPPNMDEKAVAPSTETAVLAGGCFWGVQGVFQHVNGVISATSGYTGGSKDAAHYEMVSSGETGHAESVRIVFDPHKMLGKGLRMHPAGVVAGQFADPIDAYKGIPQSWE